MSLRMPQNLSSGLRVETGEQRLLAEVAAEQASALGRLGRAVEHALHRLKTDSSEARDELLGHAAVAVWNYFVQREVIGMINHDQAIAHYGIPGEVLARVGGSRKP
ncbi:MAG TPA: DUF6665 family protein [Rhizomicrobium sp.]|jgi:hypothetical protein|nr:DUF6665 family protein [Rhizomicrobium sp.]